MNNPCFYIDSLYDTSLAWPMALLTVDCLGKSSLMVATNIFLVIRSSILPESPDDKQVCAAPLGLDGTLFA